MSPLHTSLLSGVIALITALATVWATDFLGLRRDHAKHRMELGWKLQQQRWDALYSALQVIPTFNIGDAGKLLHSVRDLSNWAEAKVEPWLSQEQAEPIRQARQKVDLWSKEAIDKAHKGATQIDCIPTQDINMLREKALNELTAELRLMRSRFDDLTKYS